MRTRREIVDPRSYVLGVIWPRSWLCAFGVSKSNLRYVLGVCLPGAEAILPWVGAYH